MKTVLISMQPKWCELIASGKKTVEVRKTKPKLETPFKCYIYQTKKHWVYKLLEKLSLYQGKIIGEFLCDELFPIRVFDDGCIQDYNWHGMERSCVPYDDISDYIGKDREGYGWHISNLVIYDKPKELSEFRKPCIYGEESDESCFLCDKSGYRPDMHIDCFNEMTRPPQSWCYVDHPTEKGGEDNA